MKSPWSRRRFVASAMAMVAAPALRGEAAAQDAPLALRCSLETTPSHMRNAIIRDYLGRIEAASGGRIKTQLFESGQLFPDLQVGKALLQGQIEMAAPGSWSLTGIVPDADFFQLPVLYGRSIKMVHRVVDSQPGQLLAKQIEQQMSSHVSLYAISATLPKFRLGILRSKDAKPGTNGVPFVNGEPPRLVGAPR